ncbi:MAG: HEAT repeat domain-containing protein [Okeania sp. SIO3B5]|uniref:HEAT repeat domain-containing protein n=1 Tax=Okeania sp. SIO3B5 TaxID=2607811 RepID=UPI0014008805|nr:HEAT repeat domain-containing protein [Okeania sp. SIO3B5]NEO56223.1 HEAT repeat domain-containing protein [Okeania sp. SIO3B5]
MDPITIAMTIDDWDFFLPRAHKNKPVKGRPYRIFEPQWKQVILLWLEREDVEEENKEEFIQALTKFKDGCKHFLPKEKLDRGFYEYRAYFLAAAGISGFGNCSQADEIVKKVVYWVCNRPYSSPYYIVQDEAIKVLLETPRKKTINALVQLLESTSNDDTLIQASEILGKINPGNEKAIHTLVKMLESASDYTLIRAAKTLGKIDPGNEKAIGVLLQVLESTSDYYTPNQVEKILEKIFGSVDYYKNINSLRMVASEGLREIGRGNEKAIDGLVQLLESTTDYHTNMEASKSLGEIGIDSGNEKAINSLVKVLESSFDDRTWMEAAHSLKEIRTKKDITTLFISLKHYLSAIEYLDFNQDRFNKSYNIIWNFTETLPYPEFYQAWHTPLKKRLWLFLCLRLFSFLLFWSFTFLSWGLMFLVFLLVFSPHIIRFLISSCNRYLKKIISQQTPSI